jgi:hypothetical protein
MKLQHAGLYFAVVFTCWAVDSPTERAKDIVRRSVDNMNADWAAAPQYGFTERDLTDHNGKKTGKTYQVMMIEGSPYNKLIALDNQPLSSAQAAEEDRKAQKEIDRRRHESPEARRKRVSQYEQERHQDHELMSEMAKAFDFSLSGEDTVGGRRCFMLDATPKSGYQPPNRETQVLKGMRGRLWVDADQYQWAKVHAEVFRPVTFGLFFARVKPGTEFTFEQRPVQGNLWLPSHFSMNLNARVFISSKRSRDDETYSDYHRATEPSKTAKSH